MSQYLGPDELLEVAKTGSLKDLLELLDNELSSNPCDSTLNTRDPSESELSSADQSEIVASSTDLSESRTDLVNVTNRKVDLEIALGLAVSQGHEVAVQTLICAGADVNKTDGTTQTLLLLAVKAANRTELERRLTADANLVEQENCVQFLLQSGADPNAQDDSGCTALMEAAGANSVNCVQLLLKAGADIGMVNNKGKTALMIASSSGSYSCVEVLVKEPNCHKDAKCDRGKTALIYAVEGIRNRCIQLVLRYGARHVEYSKQVPAFCDCVKLLIEAGADVNIRDNDGKTVLMYVSTSDNMVDLLHVILKADGVDVDLRDHLGMTAVMHAVSSESPQCLQCLKILLNRGANVNAADINGVTPLMHLSKTLLIPNALATQMQLRRKTQVSGDFLALLLCHGANVDLVDKEGRLALMYALQPNNSYTDFDIVKYFLENGADPNVNPSLRQFALDFAIHTGYLGLLKHLVKHGAELKVDREKFQEILHSNKVEILQLLIMNGMMPTPRRPTSEKYIPFPSACITTESTIHVIKYFIVNCYLHNDDLSYIYHISSPVNVTSPRDSTSRAPLKQLMVALGSQPWPLVKLCFLTVSTLLGATPGRHERIKKSQLPKRLQDMLMFNDPLLRLSNLCPYYWDEIPLTFNPQEYERLPQPRPLLYNWPVGRPLVTCDCGRCDGTMYKFQGDDEHSDSGDDEHSDSDSNL